MRATLCLAFIVATALARLAIARAHLDTWVMYETHSGTIAQALLDRIDLDYGRLPIFVHVRGSAISGFLLEPLYQLFGCSALVRKLVPLLWHALTVGLLVYVMDRFFSRRAAITAGLLFLCAPPMMAKLSVMGMGSHMESSLFMLLALIPFLAITVEKRTSIGQFFLFGLATGLAHTWHLQALLQCLILAGLLFVQMPRRLLGLPGLAIVAGAALGAAPAYFFTGLGSMDSTWEVVKFYLSPHDAPLKSALDSDYTQLYGQDSLAGKVGVLLNGGFVQMLEFYEAGPRLALLLGSTWTVLVVGASGWAVIQDRRRMAALFSRVFRFRDAEISPALSFPLHIGALLFLHLWSTHTAIELTDMSSGAFNRRMAPLVTSLMILAALGMAGVRRSTPRRLWLGLLVVTCLAGAIGQAGAARATEASSLASRGECYEWFLGQLQHDAGGDASAMIETIRRIDRGDARFRSLRFQTPMGKFDFAAPTFVEAETRWRRRSSPEYNLYRATALGRALAQEPVLLESFRWAPAAAVTAPLRGAMLHGIGLGLFVGGPNLTESWNSSLDMLRRLCEAPDAARGEAIAEGCGFLRGFNLDVYTHQVDCIDDFECLPDGARAAFYRGFGWGFRQRYASPPDHVPDGLVVVQYIPPGNLADFTDGYLLRRLPCEAATMESAQGR